MRYHVELIRHSTHAVQIDPDIGEKGLSHVVIAIYQLRLVVVVSK